MSVAERPVDATPSAAALAAVADLYHAFITGLMLTLVTRRSTADAAEWTFRLFRHQHQEKFLSSLGKLGIASLPDAVKCAAYHYLANAIGGVTVELIRESDRKAWVHFEPPRWIYPGAAICGIPSAVSRAMLRGWYAQNGVSLGNPRLGFVCTAQTTDGQHGLAGYFLEHDRDLQPEERLQFRPGELPPPFDPSAAPRLDHAAWTPERLAKAQRNYAMEYLRSGLPRLVELFGPAEARHLGRTTGQLVGAQLARATALALGIRDRDAGSLAALLKSIAEAEGDKATIARDGDDYLVIRGGWRLMRGIDRPSCAVFDAWNGLHEGLAAVHNRLLRLEVVARADEGDESFIWRIRPRPA